jgi:hypothetical protein
MKSRAIIALGFAVLLQLCACSESAPDAGFIKTPELLKKDSKEPFDAVWFKEGTDLRTYKKVYVAPVDTTHLLKMSWWNKMSAAEEFKDLEPEAEAKTLAIYMHDQVTEAFKNDKKRGYQVVDQPDKDSLLIELAIVEVLPTKVWLNAIGYIAIGALDTGKTAIEGRFRDGATNEPIVRFKDQRIGKMSVVSIADIQWYSHARHTISEWASDLLKLCEKSPEESMSMRIPVTLMPW